jgi:hypothetical protein
VAILAKSLRASPQTCYVLFSEPLEGNRIASLGTVDQYAFIVHCLRICSLYW